MLLQRRIAVAYIFLALCPVLVVPQFYIKWGVCIAFAAGFVYQGCADTVNIVCRLVALQLKFLNCRIYPCVNYGSSDSNACTDFPTGCPLEYIKVFGLCSPIKVCCGTGGVVAARYPFLKRLGLPGNLGKKVMPSGLDSLDWKDYSYAVSETDYSHIPPEFNIPVDPKDYLSDFPRNATDPKVIDEALRVQYDKFMAGVAVLSVQEMENGAEPFGVISFQDYRAVALGEKEFHEI